MIRKIQCRTRDAGGATGDTADVLAERQFDVARLIRPENPAAGRLEKPDRLGCRVPEPIARTDADHGDFRPEHGEHLGRDRSATAVMPDFQHVDIGQHATCRELLQNVALSVAGQQNTRTVVLRQEDETRGVLGRVFYRLQRPKHAHDHAPHFEPAASDGLASGDPHL